MQSKHTSEAGLFNVRVLIALALCLISGSFGWLSFASTPATDNVTVPSAPGQTVTVTWTGTIPPFSNTNPVTGSDCAQFADTPVVDQHVSTITVPAGVYSSVDAIFTFKINWNPVSGAEPVSDEILTVLDPAGNEIDSSDGGSTTEQLRRQNLAAGAYKVVVCGYQNVQPQDYTGTLTITTCPAGSGCKATATGPFGGPDPTVPGNPRYQNFYAPAGSTAQSSEGEFNIGFDPITKRIMAMNLAQVWRLTPPEVLTPAKPECCEALWEKKNPTTINVLAMDPILWTDQKTGRTFAANSFYGANFSYGYTDAAAPFNDGDLWVEAGISPPNGGQDHETIGSGPYPLISGLPSTPVNQGEMVFYCSQDGYGQAMCQRSDNLGASYGPGVPTYTGLNCAGLHGHIHVAPDGTAWLPVGQCSGQQGGVFSTDAGVSWNEFTVSGNNDVNGGAPFTSTSQTHGADPSIGLDANSTAYYCYVKKEGPGGTEGHAHVAVGKRISTMTGSTINWIRDVDIGASHGIVNAAEPEAIAGDAGRAACGFIGTNVPDAAGATYENGNFNGKWYVYIATTYDEGRTWATVNATPDDPVQNHTGVWQGGGSGESGDRNLLDFNEVTMDDKGRVLYGYSDGCHSLTCINSDNSAHERGGYMRVARQSGGKPLLSRFDVAEPTVPKAPCLSGTRNASGVHLTWQAPDNGGADITNYSIYRSTASGAETLLFVTNSNKTLFDDITADPALPVFYKVRAINNVDPTGGAFSQEVTFGPTPGIQLLSINSVKTHPTTPYGVNLPLNGSGIECRSGNTEKIVFDFANAITSSPTATLSGGTGTVSNVSVQNGNVVVDLSGVANAQRLTLTLSNVVDSANNTLPSLSVTFGVLIGDTNADGSVNSADISQVKSQSGQALSNANFREDLNLDGGINSADISLVKSRSGTGIPATAPAQDSAQQPAQQSTQQSAQQPAQQPVTVSRANKTSRRAPAAERETNIAR